MYAPFGTNQGVIEAEQQVFETMPTVSCAEE